MGQKFVTPEELDSALDRYEISHGKLCKSYREHMVTKIENSQRNIQWTIGLSTAILGIALSLFQLYLATR